MNTPVTPFVFILIVMFVFSFAMFLWELALAAKLRWRMAHQNRRRKWYCKWVPWFPRTVWWFGVSLMAWPQDVMVESNIKRRCMWVEVGFGIGSLFIERRGRVVE